MTNNLLTTERLEIMLAETLGTTAVRGEHASIEVKASIFVGVLTEVLENRKTNKPPVHPTITNEQLDDETLQELIEFRRTTFEYHSKEGNKVQTIIHGVTLSALRELQERRKTAEPELKPANLANKFYERYPLATFKSDSERAEAFGYFMAGAELQCFGEFIKYEDLCGDE